MRVVPLLRHRLAPGDLLGVVGEPDLDRTGRALGLPRVAAAPAGGGETECEDRERGGDELAFHGAPISEVPDRSTNARRVAPPEDRRAWFPAGRSAGEVGWQPRGPTPRRRCAPRSAMAGGGRGSRWRRSRGPG